MTKGAKKSVRRWISALVSSRSSITIMGDSMLSLRSAHSDSDMAITLHKLQSHIALPASMYRHICSRGTSSLE